MKPASHILDQIKQPQSLLLAPKLTVSQTERAPKGSPGEGGGGVSGGEFHPIG